MKWKAYNELAWTDTILAPPGTYQEEATFYIQILNKILRNNINKYPATMLHLGCGAGGHDYHFKKYFQLTGVDISEGMLKIARETNPEVEYISGDMRTFNLNRKFDVVIIPDSIMYMANIADLKKAISKAVHHLKSGGVFLVTTHIKEDFQNNNFAYSGEQGDTHITVFENNHIVSNSTYEATMVYLIRQKDKLHIYNEIHTLGLFSNDFWLNIFRENDLTINQTDMNHLYDKYLLEDDRYKLKIFSGILKSQIGDD
ncbi:MAG: methyltransferase [Candidatus Cloacimonas sp. SDB]|nr:MAG: methyltransferase [Candidatus Cloacimonas sp. SDB]